MKSVALGPRRAVSRDREERATLRQPCASSLAIFLGLISIAGCAHPAARQTEPAGEVALSRSERATADRPAHETGALAGVVRFTGDIPEPEVYPPEPDMLPICGHAVHRDETWLVGPERGLANCVVALHPLKSASKLDGAIPPDVHPLEGAVFAKNGCGFSPRVLVVTPHTRITLRNLNSPCRGFVARPVRNAGFNMMLPAGAEKTVVLERAEAIRVGCDVRPRMVGWIVVVDTPWFAVSGTDGRFSMPSLPAGTYAVTVWHEVPDGNGRFSASAGPTQVVIRAGEQATVEYAVAAN